MHEQTRSAKCFNSLLKCTSTTTNDLLDDPVHNINKTRMCFTLQFTELKLNIKYS